MTWTFSGFGKIQNAKIPEKPSSSVPNKTTQPAGDHLDDHKTPQMRIIAKNLWMLVLCLMFVSGCATVPKEIVELSYVIGQDIESLHTSYRSLIHRYFAQLRAERMKFIEERLIPVFIRKYQAETNFTVEVANSDSQSVNEFLEDWIEVAMDEIESRRAELLLPINQAEDSLLQYVDDAFNQVVRANAAVTAHLNSSRNVQQIHDEALKSFRLSDLKERIDTGLTTASSRADEVLERIKRAEGIID